MLKRMILQLFELVLAENKTEKMEMVKSFINDFFEITQTKENEKVIQLNTDEEDDVMEWTVEKFPMPPTPPSPKTPDSEKSDENVALILNELLKADTTEIVLNEVVVVATVAEVEEEKQEQEEDEPEIDEVALAAPPDDEENEPEIDEAALAAPPPDDEPVVLEEHEIPPELEAPEEAAEEVFEMVTIGSKSYFVNEKNSLFECVEDDIGEEIGQLLEKSKFKDPYGDDDELEVEELKVGTINYLWDPSTRVVFEDDNGDVGPSIGLYKNKKLHLFSN
jgi:hypothetical protein